MLRLVKKKLQTVGEFEVTLPMVKVPGSNRRS